MRSQHRVFERRSGMTVWNRMENRKGPGQKEELGRLEAGFIERRAAKFDDGGLKDHGVWAFEPGPTSSSSLQISTWAEAR